jgi:hypothetical protein
LEHYPQIRRFKLRTTRQSLIIVPRQDSISAENGAILPSLQREESELDQALI